MKRRFIPLLLLPVLAVTACGYTGPKPEGYDDKQLIVLPEDKDVYNNLDKIIYDAKLDSGAVASEVLDAVLLELSNSIYGDFFTLEGIANGTIKGEAVKEFLNKHKVYWELDADKNRVTSDEAYAHELKRIELTHERIEDRIANKFFSAIKSAFTRDGYFFEEDYVMSLKNGLKNVKNVKTTNGGVLVPPEFDGKDVFTAQLDSKKGEGKTTLLNKANYLFTDKEGHKCGYYVDEMIPNVYRELLVEQYLFDSNYSTISRAYARNVDIITINNRDDSTLAANDLMNAYIDNFIFNENEPDGDNSFKVISAAWRGFNLPALTENSINGSVADQATYLLNSMGLEPIEFTKNSAFIDKATVAPYYEGTSYGSLVKKLDKIDVNPKLNDSAIESEFTNNGEYTVAQGFEAKKVKVQQENYITDGWHIRNGGLSSLNEKIRTRLFNIGVANALDNAEYPDRMVKNGETTTYFNHPDGENPYVAKIHGRYFLKPSVGERQDDPNAKVKDILWFDDANNSYTIVEINEAVSTSKLTKNSDSSYEFTEFEKISHEVAYEIAKGESYKSLSTKYWLEQIALTYHDEKVLEYFKSNYPELFDEEVKKDDTENNA